MNFQRSQIYQKKLSSYRKIVYGVILLLVFIFLWIRWAGGTPIGVTKSIKIPKGTTISVLDKSLELKISHFRYKLWQIFFAPNLELKTGIFQVPEEVDTLHEFFELMKNPTSTEEEITFLPGWHKGEVSAKMRELGVEGDLIAEEKAIIQSLVSKYPFLAGKTSLEGFLMPDTYRISGASNVTNLVERMLDNFDARIYQPFLQSGKPVESFYDVLILASIVGEEEKSSTQVETVAGILKKRLRAGWQIGADITACYPELVPGSECQRFVNNFYSLSESARKEKNNAYDTRRIAGLPPTPIAGVSAPTFMSTLNATAETPYWFYLHDGSGILHGATTNEEHEQNKALYLR